MRIRVRRVIKGKGKGRKVIQQHCLKERVWARLEREKERVRVERVRVEW